MVFTLMTATHPKDRTAVGAISEAAASLSAAVAAASAADAAGSA